MVFTHTKIRKIKIKRTDDLLLVKSDQEKKKEGGRIQATNYKMIKRQENRTDKEEIVIRTVDIYVSELYHTLEQ